MGLSNFFDDVLGFDPNGGGISNLWRGLAGSGIPGLSQFAGLGMALVGPQGYSGLDPKYFKDFVESYKKSYDEARTANLQRYDEILGNMRAQRKGARAESAENINYLKGQRKQAVLQNRRQFQQLQSNSEQNLMDRGLSNTTLLPTLRSGIQSDRNMVRNDIRNAANQAILSERRYGQNRIDNINNNLLRFKEARTDAYPDLAPLLTLANQYGTAEGNDRARYQAQIQGFLGGLGNRNPFSQGGMGGGYPGQTLPWNPYPSGQQQQQGGGLGSILSGIGGLAGLFF